MGLFGGSSQSTSSIVSSIDFSPIIQFGENQESGYDKVSRQDSTVSPKLDDSLGLSVGVGVLGGSGTGGAVTDVGSDDTTGKTEAPLKVGSIADIDPKYFLIIGGAIALFMIFKKKKKKK